MEIKLKEGTRLQCTRYANKTRAEEAKLRQLGGSGNYSAVAIRPIFEHGTFLNGTSKVWAVFGIRYDNFTYTGGKQNVR